MGAPARRQFRTRCAKRSATDGGRNDPDELWRDDESLRKAIRPVLADVGETAQFLAIKRLALEQRDSRPSFSIFSMRTSLQRFSVSKGSLRATTAQTSTARVFQSLRELIPARRLCSCSTDGWLNANRGPALLKAGNTSFEKWKTASRGAVRLQSRTMRPEHGLKVWSRRAALHSRYLIHGLGRAMQFSVGQSMKT